ncbi:SufD family Fe-S cluster assembly protein [Paracoccus sediminis]|uniref:Fe-S cluster assembly protein SufD n=1 Tax=Paracoccus sediminis TaxID=1214787 RepID=A0A238Y2F5_9RHOB|nr:SufD family Fe-S cluster assembly protein [Paracoccus sediminis]TBN47198.1 SufD family Fe-S cluster assembly protein [Paracoccus sediminis]SNR64971.1 Fe-S cluster assembly protein SufD [Paracoccus sediminis]
MADLAVRTKDQTPSIEGAPKPAGALDARLAALNLPQGGFAAARQDAAARLREMGLPGPRDEYWRYTDPRRFNAPAPAALPIPQADETPLFDGLDKLTLVFVDGAFDKAASDDLALQGVEIATLAQADAGKGWAGDLYGVLEARGQKPVKRPFAALNTAYARDGLLIRVTATPAKPIHVVHRRGTTDADAMWHHVIRIERGAELTLLETGMSGARSNSVIEVDVAEGGTFHHVASKRAADPRVGIGHIFARVAAQAQFKSFALSVNGTTMRNETVIDIAGDDAVAHVAAAVLGDGERAPFHHDDTVFITHGAERCESRQVFKKVLKNGATGVFQGKILVRPGAQKTDGYQISQALLLDERSQFLAKPELEIYADDVKCSHGSTTGAIDDEALFYLRSRGVPRERAIVFLVLSFLADALAEVEDDGIRDRIYERLDVWLTLNAVQ